MTLLWVFLQLLAAGTFAVVLGNVVGWLSVQGCGRRPWSWRVLLGPPFYYPWLDRQE